MPTTREDFRRYQSMIESMLAGAGSTDFTQENSSTVQIETGLVYRDALLNSSSPVSIEPLLRWTDGAQIVDASGQRRAVYPPLLIYCWLKTFQLRYETLPRAEFGKWEESLHARCDQLESGLDGVDWPAGAMPASTGARIAQAAWAALTISVAGKLFVRDAWTDLAADTFGRISKRQLEIGALLNATESDNIETRGYDELAILHACASYAVQSEDRAVAKLVARATEFHAREIQADHSTNQPWALFAFIWNESTRATADQLLHAATAQTDGVSILLLADALHCLQLFTA